MSYLYSTIYLFVEYSAGMKSNSLVQPCAGWLQFLRAVTVCYKLDGAIQIFTSARIRRFIEKYAESITTEDIFEGASLETLS